MELKEVKKNEIEPIVETGTWAIVEIMGHRTVAGRVEQVHFGSTAMLKITTPELPEIKGETKECSSRIVVEEISNHCHHPIVLGTRTQIPLPSEPESIQFFPESAIFSIRCCTEQSALDEIGFRRPSLSWGEFVPDPKLDIDAVKAQAIKEWDEFRKVHDYSDDEWNQ